MKRLIILMSIIALIIALIVPDGILFKTYKFRSGDSVLVCRLNERVCLVRGSEPGDSWFIIPTVEFVGGGTLSVMDLFQKKYDYEAKGIEPPQGYEDAWDKYGNKGFMRYKGTEESDRSKNTGL